MYRVGIGYDIHRLVENRKLILGGIEIPYIKGLLGHSDADVLIHAIIDALLGAIGESDIGTRFPDTDEKYRDISSLELLKLTDTLLKKDHWQIVNIDTVLVAEAPNLAAFKNKIKENIALVLNILPNKVSVKAKTNEGLGEIGNKEAIACYATVMISNTQR